MHPAQSALNLVIADSTTRSPLVVSYGVGVDSTAMLIALWRAGEKPDLILTADTGDEKPETYAYLPVMDRWLASVGFPAITVVRNQRPQSGDKSLSDAVIRLGVLPALAYGAHQCSLVWKRDPQVKYIRRWPPALRAWSEGLPVVNCIGYDAGARDSARRYKAEGKELDGFTNRFPLIENGWDRKRCEQEIVAVGLPVPVKSACFHCPASKRSEILWLRDNHPDLHARALLIEAAALPKAHARRADGKNWTPGLGRSFAWADLDAAA